MALQSAQPSPFANVAEAAWALGELAVARATPLVARAVVALRQVLSRRGDSPAEAAVRANALAALGRLGVSELVDAFWLADPNPAVRANAAWLALTAISHNLMRTLAALTNTPRLRAARGATLRRTLIAIPARLARPARTPVLHLPRHWPTQHAFTTLWAAVNTT